MQDTAMEPSRGVLRRDLKCEARQIHCNTLRLAIWEASFQSPFSLIEATLPAQHLRSLLLWADDIERNPGPFCVGCLKTIRCDFHPIACTTC